MDLIQIYEDITPAVLQSYIDTMQEEHLYLEFKEISNPDFSNKDDKKNLAKVISGFANSDGGIVIWGIKAKKNDQGIDCAQALMPIDNVSLLVSRLNSLTSDFASPLVDGIRHEKLDVGQDRGFVKTLIPVSLSGPHMAKAGENRYYKRNGDSFQQMEHFDIADMFGRRLKPQLALSTKIMSGYTQGSNIQCRVIISIRNTGKGIAKYPYLAIHLEPPYTNTNIGLHGNSHHNLPRVMTIRPEWYIFAGDANSVIHINSELDITEYAFKIDTTRKQLSTGERMQDLKIMYEIAAENCPTIVETKTIDLAEVLRGVGIYER